MPTIEKIDEELTKVKVGDREFDLRELKIKKCRQLSETVVNSHRNLVKKLKEMGPETDISAIGPLADEIGEKITSILNIIFNLSGDQVISQQWYEENFTLTELELVIAEASRQSRMDWLPPFFDRLSHLAILASPNLMENQESLNGNPII